MTCHRELKLPAQMDDLCMVELLLACSCVMRMLNMMRQPHSRVSITALMIFKYNATSQATPYIQ
jgi:hypothetical protein